MLKINQDGINLIKSYESFLSSSYICPAGLATIGYGHVIQPGEKFSQITEIEAEELLLKDIAITEKAVSRLVKVKLTINQFNSLVSFTFNLGAGTLQRSSLRQKINRAEHDLVPAELMRFVFCNGRKLLGLVRRRREEARLYMI